jgi:probable addiction module antidote protein
MSDFQLSRFDAAEHLKTPEDIAAYLDAALEEAGDDASFFAHALGVVARAQNMSKLSRDTGISRQGLVKALADDGNPSFGTVLKVTKALGLKLVIEAA